MSPQSNRSKSLKLNNLAKRNVTDEEAAITLITDPMVDINFSPANENGRTPLRQAARYGHVKMVEALLKDPRIDVNKASIQSWTPLYISTYYGHEKVVKLLLEHPKIDVNPRTWNGTTPLLLACEGGNEKMVRLLLEHPNINVNQADIDGWTPLLVVAYNGNQNAVKMLLAFDKPIDVLAKPKSGPEDEDWRNRTAAEQAKAEKNMEIYELLKSFEPSGDLVETKRRQDKIRFGLRKELGLKVVVDSAKLLSLVVLLSDDYLRFKPIQENNDQDSPNKKNLSFFQINLKLPLELQSMICNYAYIFNSCTILTTDFNQGLESILQSFEVGTSQH